LLSSSLILLSRESDGLLFAIAVTIHQKSNDTKRNAAMKQNAHSYYKKKTYIKIPNCLSELFFSLFLAGLLQPSNELEGPTAVPLQHCAKAVRVQQLTQMLQSGEKPFAISPIWPAWNFSTLVRLLLKCNALLYL